jgi:DNA-directed RNA polymerase subunit RPC12/RpoP
MSSFFSLYTKTPWDGLKTSLLSQVKLMSLKDLFKSFPVIEQTFFEDVLSNVYNQNHYSWMKTIKRIVGPSNEDYDISSFNLLWAFDNDNRMYQLLFQKVKEKEKSQAVLVALAPPELGRLLGQHKSEALHRILSLLNKPKNIKFLMILAPKGKSIAEEQQLVQISKARINKLQNIQELGHLPNISGQWFPTTEIRCPSCNKLLVNIANLNQKIGFGQFVCPYCGYKKKIII